MLGVDTAHRASDPPDIYDPVDPCARQQSDGAAVEPGPSRGSLQYLISWSEPSLSGAASTSCVSWGLIHCGGAAAVHNSPHTTKFYDFTGDAIMLDEDERITI